MNYETGRFSSALERCDEARPQRTGIAGAVARIVGNIRESPLRNADGGAELDDRVGTGGADVALGYHALLRETLAFRVGYARHLGRLEVATQVTGDRLGGTGVGEEAQAQGMLEHALVHPGHGIEPIRVEDIEVRDLVLVDFLVRERQLNREVLRRLVVG